MDEKMGCLNVLFLTYAYPPQKFPRSVQISHLVQYLRNDFNITVITSEPENEGDFSLLSFTPLDNVVYAEKSSLTKFIERSKGSRIKKEFLPDFQYLWHFDVLKKTQSFINLLQTNTIVTFGQPMSTHIAGLKLKKKYPHIKWLAHFSDPWVDNIFNNYNRWTRLLNKHYQDRVFNVADKLIFTSQETVDLVTRDYPDEVRAKSICIPHIFNQDLYSHQDHSKNEKTTIRYVGNFYGSRQPDSLLKALQQLSHEQRKQLRIEFIGSSTPSLKEMIQVCGLEDIVFIQPSVSYIDSLKLMCTADILLIINAPTENSPFLPSKLVDYISANKPIFGITPSGTSQKLIEEMGFLVADPRDTLEIADKLMRMTRSCCNDELQGIPSSIRNRYVVSTVGMQMKGILENL